MTYIVLKAPLNSNQPTNQGLVGCPCSGRFTHISGHLSAAGQV